MSKDTPLVHVLIAAIARSLAEHPLVPPEHRAAFGAAAPRVVEAAIRSVLGCDSVTLTGWLIPPSERLARRERIHAAIHNGETAAAIASRELVSVRWVRKLRADLVLSRPRGELTALTSSARIGDAHASERNRSKAPP